MDGSVATRELCQRLADAVASAAQIPLAELDFGSIIDATAELDRAAEQLQALRSAMLRQADLVAVDGERAAERVYNDVRQNLSQARAQVRQSRTLDDYPLLREAWLAGDISQAQLRGMLRGLKKVPLKLGPEQVTDAQRMLIGFARTLDPRGLAKAAAKIGEKLDPASFHEAERRRVELDARQAERNRSVTFFNDGEGTIHIKAKLPIAEGTLYWKQLIAMQPSVESYRAIGVAAPAPATRLADGLIRWLGFFSKVNKQFLGKYDAHLDKARKQGSLLDQKRAEAEYGAQLRKILAALPDVGGDRPQVFLTVDKSKLRAGAAQGELPEVDALLSNNQTATWVCDSVATEVLLGENHEPLNAGRSKRYVEGTLRKAVVARDRGCSFPGCDAAAILCDAHHRVPWRYGGITALSNITLLCLLHHPLVEPKPDISENLQWRFHLDEETGYPIYIPPRDVDPRQRPRCHWRYLMISESLQRRFAPYQPVADSDVGAYGIALPPPTGPLRPFPGTEHAPTSDGRLQANA